MIRVSIKPGAVQGLGGLSYCLIVPFAWALRALDLFDRQKDWTLGYCLLCLRAGSCGDPSDEKEEGSKLA
jgi:hypothetical protein